MRTVEQFITDLDIFNGYLENSFTEDILTRSVLDMTDKIVSRVQQTGKLSDGTTRAYSTKTTLVGASSFKNKGTFEQLLSKAKGATKSQLKGKIKQGGKMIESGYHWVTISHGGPNNVSSPYYQVHLVVLPGGYAKIRQMEGQDNVYKNYFRTGVMWRNTGLIESKTTKERVYIGGQTEEAQKLLNVNSWRDKTNILLPTEKEKEEAAVYIRKELIRFMNEKLAKNV